MKLVSMINYVLITDNKSGSGGHYDKIVRYAKFLNKPLSLGMFIPVSEDGKVLKKPKSHVMYNTQRFECTADEMRDNRVYLEAEKKVLFESWDKAVIDFNSLNNSLTFTIENSVSTLIDCKVESLINLGLSFKLKKEVVKRLNL